MQSIVQIGGKRVRLDASKTLGVGGEGTVVEVGTYAAKIFHKPSSARTEKLRDFLRLGQLPSTVCSPVEVIYNSTGRNVIGYLMPRLSPQYEVVQKLASKKHRRRHPSITSEVVTDIHLSGHDTIVKLHALGIVIGDNNDLNAMFWRRRMAYIDPDSFQFGHHPCAVGTEYFLDPRLYDVQLDAKPHFRTLDDWYAWFVMYIRSLLMVHPYGGVHKIHRTIPQRAVAKLTFRDVEVKYPKVGLHPDLMNDTIASMFERMFEKGERFIPDRDALVDYRDSLKKCLSCDTMYPGEKSSCPQCSKVNTQQVQRQVKIIKRPGKRTVTSDTLISTPGEILWHHVTGKSVYVIANEKQQLVLYKYIDAKLTRMDLFPFVGVPRFGFFGGKYLACNNNGDVHIFDVSGSKLFASVGRHQVDSYQGEPVFACSKDHLLWVNKGFLFRSAHDPRFGWSNDNVGAVSRDQTWIAASSHSSLVFGCQRLFETLKFFSYRFEPSANLWYSPINDLQEDESIIDVSTIFTGSSIFLLLKTEIKGRTYTHIYVLYKDEIKFHSKVEALSSDLYRNIHGKAFGVSGSTMVVLHPTDDGIVQESIGKKSKAVLLSETEPFISDGDTLDQYVSGILVTGDQSINYLVIS